ncbi:MAG: PQQ-dependent sugar dehydrogenase, partial [Bacteroidota bacterium]
MYVSLAGLKAQTFSDSGFVATLIKDDLPNDVIGFTLLPDERIITIRRSGNVQVLADGVLSSPILSLSDVKTAGNGEQGLLGITHHPAFPDSSFIYLFYTQTNDTNQVFRCELIGDLDDPRSTNLSFDLSTRDTIIEFFNETQFHQAGSLRFGIDGKLYIAHGDDARKHFIQDYRNYRGKILRLNPNGSIPADNPVFPNQPPDALGGIFALGLRNPFRFAIDPSTGALFIGDVGSETREELNVATGGENFGWPRYEGDWLSIDTARLLGDPVAPIYDYAHITGNFSAIALAAYRTSSAPQNLSFPPEYDGAMFYADYFRGPLYALIPTTDSTYTRKNF